MIIPVTIEDNDVRIKATESSHTALTVQWVVRSWATMTARTRSFLIKSFVILNPHPTISSNDWCMVISKLFSGELPYKVDGEDVLFQPEGSISCL